MGNYLNQSDQLGFGKPTGALVLDQTMDQVWGLLVFGGVAAWRGGENKLNSYRAPTATAYGYAGYFLGPFVPAFGLALSGFKGHDIDRNSQQARDTLLHCDSKNPRSPWGFLPWTVALGVSVAPF